MDVDAGRSGRNAAWAAAGDSASAAAEAAAADAQQPLSLTEEEEAETFAVFDDLMSHLPDDFKYKLLLDALQRGGPAVLEGIEEARDAIIYAASRRNPALLRNIVQFVESGGADEMPDDGEGNGDENEDSDDDGDAASSIGAAKRSAAAGTAAAPATAPVAGMSGFAALGLNTSADQYSSAARLQSALGASAESSVPYGGARLTAAGTGASAAAAAPAASMAPVPGSEEDMQRFLAAVLGTPAAGSGSSSGMPTAGGAGIDAGAGGAAHAADGMYLQGMSAQEQSELIAARAAYAETQALLMGGAAPSSSSAAFGGAGSAGGSAAALPGPRLAFESGANDHDDDDDDGNGGFGLR